MDKKRLIMAVATAAVLLGALFVYLAFADSKPTESIKLAGGEEASVTPIDKMRVRTAEERPDVDLETYRLEVGGLVERDLALSLTEIRSMPVEERYVRLPCVEGWSEDGLWKGIRLSALLDRAGVRADARTVVFSSPGGYTTSLTLEDVEKTDPVLAFGVNNQRLPDEQGYPLRLVVPGKLGYKWIKWVDSIELIGGEHLGYWESRGYSNEADAEGI